MDAPTDRAPPGIPAVPGVALLTPLDLAVFEKRILKLSLISAEVSCFDDAMEMVRLPFEGHRDATGPLTVGQRNIAKWSASTPGAGDSLPAWQAGPALLSGSGRPSALSAVG